MTEIDWCVAVGRDCEDVATLSALRDWLLETDREGKAAYWAQRLVVMNLTARWIPLRERVIRLKAGRDMAALARAMRRSRWAHEILEEGHRRLRSLWYPCPCGDCTSRYRP